MKKEGAKTKRVLVTSLVTATLGALIAINAVVLPGCNSTRTIDEAETPTDNPVPMSIQVTVYQSPGCNCCTKYVAYLKEEGLQVNVIYFKDGDSLREKYSVPQNLRSCHITIVEAYFVEGHMPVEVILKLLEEKPDIDGITLPGMPSGSPGMPSEMTEAFTIYALVDGKSSEFMTIDEY